MKSFLILDPKIILGHPLPFICMNTRIGGHVHRLNQLLINRMEILSRKGEHS